MEDSDLFEMPSESASAPDESSLPLAARMRPKTLEEVIGQEHLLAPGKLLRRTLEADRLMSAIFFGPPGCGKTTLARLIARSTKSVFAAVNAVTSNVSELRQIIEKARKFRKQGRTVLFVDEIHRFNKAQQDVLMPDVEEGVIILIGATTQNPSFSINGPLLSRSLLFELRALDDKDLKIILERTIRDPERGFGKLKIEVESGALEHLIQSASGDARRALNALELGILSTPSDSQGIYHFTRQVAEESCQRKIVYHDRDGDYHYDTISAFIKSIRGSDPDAALYWLAKMLHAGEDPRFIMRRLLILASEDIGNADSKSLILAASALQTLEFIGMPEAQITLAHVTSYLAAAPKSNAAYMGLMNALEDVKNERIQDVPDALRDGHYSGAERLGRGEGYLYPHDFPGNYVPQSYMPGSKTYYYPTANGEERIIGERLQKLKSAPKPPQKKS